MEISVTDIVNGYRILIDFEFDVIFEDREGSEHSAGRHGGRFFSTGSGKLTFLLPEHNNLRIRVHFASVIQNGELNAFDELRDC